jgi:hypothetical protein
VSRTDEILAYIHEVALPLVREHGWHVQGHCAETDGLGGNITYTVGLTEAGLPELAVSGLPHGAAATILNHCARTHLRQELGVDMRYRTGAGTNLHVIDAPGVMGPLARTMYGAAVRFRQLLWACPHGHYPNFPQWGDDHPRQPVYAIPLPSDMLPTGDGVVGHLDEVTRRNDQRQGGQQ